MRVRVLLISALALHGLLAFPADRKLNDKQLESILRYYDDCSYVAENSSLQEIARFVSMVQRSQKPHLGLFDARGRRVFEAIAETQGVVLYIDPGIFAFPPLGPLWHEYFYTTTPIEVIALDTDSVRIRVRRTSAFPLARPAQPAASGQPNRPPSVPFTRTEPWPMNTTPFVMEQIDEWVRVGGAWRLKSLHYIEV